MSYLPYRGPWVLTDVDDEAEPPPEGESEKCTAFLLARLRCPIVTTGFAKEHLNHLCQIAWLGHCETYQVDREASYVLDPQDLDHDIDRAVGFWLEVSNDACIEAHNVATWYAGARRHFLESVKPLTVNIADKDAYPKHYPPAGAKTEADIARVSRGKGTASLLHPRITVEVQAELFADIQTDIFDEIVHGAVSRCSLACSGVVGYSEGKPVEFLAFEWSESGVAHCYPISEAQAARLEGPRLHSMTRY